MKIDISQLEFIDKRLRSILVYAEDIVGAELVITSLYRIGDHGVHGQLPLRGADLRMRNKFIAEEIAKRINESWVYDTSRPNKDCAIPHGDGSNYHLHIQVHPNTKVRE